MHKSSNKIIRYIRNLNAYILLKYYFRLLLYIETSNKMNGTTLKKGDKVILTYACFEDYECTVIKALKHKIIIDAHIIDKRIVLKDNIRTLERHIIRSYNIVDVLPNIINTRNYQN